MTAKRYSVSVPVAPLQRGFWLYILEVEIDGKTWHYVGRTGDNGHLTACDPFSRLAMHIRTGKADNIVDKLYFKTTNNRVTKESRRNREIEVWDASSVKFECYGPIFPEEKGDGGIDHKKKHHESRKKIAELENGLIHAMEGYNLLNRSKGRPCEGNELWPQVLAAFSEEFPKLKERSAHRAFP